MLETSRSLPTAERFIQSALDALSAHVAILNHEGEIIGVNAAWRNFADSNGFKDTTYGIGTNYLRVCDAAAINKSPFATYAASGIRDVMRGKSSNFQLEYPCHNNTDKRWFVMQVTRFDWDSSPRYVIAHQNVTALKVVQNQLQENQQYLQAILDNVPNGIITINPRGQIESANPAAAGIFGYSVGDLYECPFQHLMSDPHCDMTTHELLEDIRVQRYLSFTGVRQDRSEFPMYLATSQVALGNRRIHTIIIQDLTERQRMEAEIIENERLNIALGKERELRELKNRFISMMSHELRTPLTSIMLSGDMLKHYSDRAPEEEKALYINNIHQQIEHINELIRDVQTISKTEEHQVVFAPEYTNVVEYLQKMADEFNLTYQHTHIIHFASSTDAIHSMMDPKLMRSIIANLLTNALKYSPDGGSVNLHLHNGGSMMSIAVQDHGIGIPKEDIPRLFEPFHRGANVETLPGTGLGLAIAKQAVELHEGEIKIDSVVGEGTTIVVELPVIDTP